MATMSNVCVMNTFLNLVCTTTNFILFNLYLNCKFFKLVIFAMVIPLQNNHFWTKAALHCQSNLTWLSSLFSSLGWRLHIDNLILFSRWKIHPNPHPLVEGMKHAFETFNFNILNYLFFLLGRHDVRHLYRLIDLFGKISGYAKNNSKGTK